MENDDGHGHTNEDATASLPDDSVTLDGYQLLGDDGVLPTPGGPRVTLGSHLLAHVRLKDPAVSRFHCELRAAERGVWVVDLGSRNGTFVDGVRVREALLTEGCRLRVGQTVLRYQSLASRGSRDVSEKTRFGAVVGHSVPMREVFAVLERAAPTEATVLIEGETGTGKGAIAEAIHAASPRADRPFVVVDCGAIAPTLLESELFGHERGAFTGADRRRVGAFEEAARGTVFLDEVGEMTADLQVKLLRVIENRTFRRLGSNSHNPVDLRIVAATNRDLRILVNDGLFRADLYYRLAVVRVRVPPLRERAGDIGDIVRELLAVLGASPAQRARLTSDAFLASLERSAWPGNVRELRNHLERCLVLENMSAASDPPADEPTSLALARRRALESFERRYLEDLLRRSGGKVARAAEEAGVARVYLYRLLAKHGLGKT